ncbi:Alpha/Beta hydrolase protein [Blastocladiella britannica]|nr:Alpha/Beta hydrolase protein [Blastocladiella britannica]
MPLSPTGTPTATNKRTATSDSAVERDASPTLATAPGTGATDTTIKPRTSVFGFFFVWALLTRAILPTLVSHARTGVLRPNRSRGLDLFLRFFRAASQLPGMDVHRSRAVLALIANLDAPLREKLRAGCTFDPVVVAVDPRIIADLPAGAVVADTVAAEWVGFEDQEKAVKEENRDKVVLYMHGGAYVFSSAESYRHMVAPVARAFGRRIFNLDYTLSPEAVYPTAVRQAAAAVLYLTSPTEVGGAGYAPSSVLLMGDSAGGNLCMATLLYLRDQLQVGTDRMPSGAVLLSPWSDLRHNLPSYEQNKELDYINPFDKSDLNPVALLCGTSDYLGMVETDEVLSPVLDKGIEGDVSRRLPPIYISTGMDEILVDENILLAANLSRRSGSGSLVVHDLTEHQVHVFPFLAPRSHDARAFWARASAFVEECDTRAALSVPRVDAWGKTVEARIWRDGAPVSQGPSATWATRWPAIAAAKSKLVGAWPVERFGIGMSDEADKDIVGSAIGAAHDVRVDIGADRDSAELDDGAAAAEGVVRGAKL